MSFNMLEASSAPTTSATPESSPPSAPTPRSTASTAISDLLPCLILRFWRIVYEQVIERKRVGEDVVADRRATDVDGVEGDRVSSALGHLDRPKRGVHLGGDGGDSAVDDRAYQDVC